MPMLAKSLQGVLEAPQHLLGSPGVVAVCSQPIEAKLLPCHFSFGIGDVSIGLCET